MTDEEAHGRALAETGFWGRRGAGCVVYARSTGRYLLQLRSSEVLQAGTWGVWGGAIDQGHSAEDCVLAELHQETGFEGIVDLHFLIDYVDEKSGFVYSNYLAVIDDEFEPRLNWEGEDFGWFEQGEWPSPLHFGLAFLLEEVTDPAKIIRSDRPRPSPRGSPITILDS